MSENEESTNYLFDFNINCFSDFGIPHIKWSTEGVQWSTEDRNGWRVLQPVPAPDFEATTFAYIPPTEPDGECLSNATLLTIVQEAWESGEQELAGLAAVEDPPSEDSTVTGNFEFSSPLRAEDDQDDTLGSETDPGAMGQAETWFRRLYEEGE